MIGLIFGETNFPTEILKKIKKKRLNYLIIDLSKSKKFKKDKKSYSVSIGEFGKIISILKDNSCEKVLFAGKVSKPNFSILKMDLKGIYYMPRIIKSSKIGDAAILKEIINILKEQSIKTISSLSFNPELSLKKGNYSKTKPNTEDKKDSTKWTIEEHPFLEELKMKLQAAFKDKFIDISKPENREKWSQILQSVIKKYPPKDYPFFKKLVKDWENIW